MPTILDPFQLPSTLLAERKQLPDSNSARISMLKEKLGRRDELELRSHHSFNIVTFEMTETGITIALTNRATIAIA